MFVKRVVVTAASVGCLALGATTVGSAATTAPSCTVDAKTAVQTCTTLETYGPVVTPGWASTVYGFSARDICHLLQPTDTARHTQVSALGLSLTYKTVSSASAESQGAAGAVSSVSGVQTLTAASALASQCR